MSADHAWHVPWRRRHRRGDDEDAAGPAPDLNPVLLIPGIGGSILNAVSDKGVSERVWVRLFLADKEFRAKLWSIYQPETGKSVSLDPGSHIAVPEDNFGLYAVDTLDPDISLASDLTGYYHSMIVEMRKWGLKDGETLFGYGYDFRQSNRLPEHMSRLLKLLRDIHKKTGKKVDVVTHSMGGMLFRSFVSLHHDDVADLVDKWITIATPFQGAPGFIMDTLLTGVEFVRGWESSLFVTKWSMHQLLVECPSVYELLANYSFQWESPPELRIVHKAPDSNECNHRDSTSSSNSSSVEGIKTLTLRDLPSILDAMREALKDNSVPWGDKTIPLPLNNDIVELARETRELWSTTRLPESVKFFNIYGVCLDTPFHSQYGTEISPLSQFSDILHTDVKFVCVNGDGTVPVESSMADGFQALYRIGVPGEHRALLNDSRVHNMVSFFLKVPPVDDFYDPYTDFILLPSRKEIENEIESEVEDDAKEQPGSRAVCFGEGKGCLMVEVEEDDVVDISVMPERP